jgi:hypothetical protein
LKTYLVSNGAIWLVSLKGKAANKDVDAIAAAKQRAGG